MEATKESDKSVPGICPGAQLLAAVCGARVYRNPQEEIGWFPVNLTAEALASPIFQPLSAQLTAFQWDGDTFDPTHGVIRIAENEACLNQAFVCGSKMVGLQFHLEMARTSLEDLIHRRADDLIKGPYVRTLSEMLRNSVRFEAAHEAQRLILNRLSA